MSNCHLCDLSIKRTHVVLGIGNPKANIMVIGEAPGYTEDKQGKPFVGESGKLLRELLETIGLNESNVYITNIVKCRPPNNRTPDNTEISICTKYFLIREIEAVKPIFIITVGKTATDFITGQNVTMANVINKVFKVGIRWVAPIYHPSYILQNLDKLAEYKKSFLSLQGNLYNTYYNYLFDIISDYNGKDTRMDYLNTP